MPEFGIHAVEKSDDFWIVTGRCFSGTIRIGTEFTKVSEFVAKSLSPALPVSLRVESIEIYGIRVEEIQEGLTARLWLSGSGSDGLDDGWALRS